MQFTEPNDTSNQKNYRFAYDIDGYYMGLVRKGEPGFDGMSTAMEPMWRQGHIPRWKPEINNWVLEIRGEKALRRDFQTELVEKLVETVDNSVVKHSASVFKFQTTSQEEFLKVILEMQTKHTMFNQKIAFDYRELVERDILRNQSYIRESIFEIQDLIKASLTPWYVKLWNKIKDCF